MKILIFSDFHFHPWTYGSTMVYGVNSRLQAQLKVGARLIKSAKEHNVGAIVFCGDLFHAKGLIPESALWAANSFISELAKVRKPIFILVGNHDTNKKDMSQHSLEWAKFHECYVLDKPWHSKQFGFSFHSYTEDKAKLQEFLNLVPKDYYTFLHQGISGVKLGSGFVIPNEILTPDMIPSHVLMAFTGHYHEHTKVSSNLTVIGAPMQHDWSDEGGKRGWIILDTERNTFEHIESVAPKFVTIFAGKIADKDLTPIVNNNYVKVKGVTESFENVKSYLLALGALSVEFEIPQTKNSLNISPKEAFSISQIVAEFMAKNKIIGDQARVCLELQNGTYEIPEFKS